MTVEGNIRLDSIDEETASTPLGAFRFTDDAVAAVARIAEQGTQFETFRALAPAKVLELAEATTFVPSIGVEHAERAWHRPILLFADSANISGITLGMTIYLRSPHELTRWKLLVHEFVHVAQYEIQGRPRFLTNYVAEYLQSRMRGRSDHEAYLGLRAEQEARAVETIAQLHRPRTLPYVAPRGHY